MWVASADDARVYAYELDGGARQPDLDIGTLEAAGNSMPVDLWSDGFVMWVLDKRDRKIYAYDLESKQRLEYLDFEALERRNDWPSGLWSDGEHMWVSDADDTRAYAYVMPAVLGLDTLEVPGVELVRSPSEFRARVARGTASVTVTAVAADSAHTVTISPADADDGTEGHQWRLALGENTLEITVSDGTGSRTYIVTVVRVDVDALSDDATLSSLSVDGAPVAGFASDVLGYRLRVAHDVASVTVAATATVAAAQVTISPADADPDTAGHQVALDVGPNRVTVAVAASDGLAEAAYTLTISRRGSQDQPGGPPAVNFGADRGAFTEGICAVGDTLWVAFRSKSKLQAYDRSTGERDAAGDLPIGHPARGVWCDGETLWYTSGRDHSTIFAYDVATGTRREDREFDISALSFNASSGGNTWNGPLGIASDGETMWVASDSRDAGNRLYALDMSTKAHKPEADIALGQRFYPRGLYSDGEILWVASSLNPTVRAYDIATLARIESLDLDITPSGSWGLWSDGEHMWVCNFRHTTLRAYPMPESYGPRLETLEVSGVELVGLSSTEYRGHVVRGVALVTVTAVPADDSDTVTFDLGDADGGVEGHQWSLGLGGNTLEVTVSDGAGSRVYTITVVRVDVDVLSDDATLGSLSVDGAPVEGFASDVLDYELEAAEGAASATVAATATEDAAQVTISPADADPDTAGHQVALDVGPNVVAVTVVATDGLAESAYTLTISHPYSPFAPMGPFDVDGFGRTGRRLAFLWSNGATVWVSEPKEDSIEAYDLAGGGRQDNKRIGGLMRAGNEWARGIWSDGDTIWVADFEDSKLYAYALDGGARRPGLDFDTLEAAGNASPRGVWSDGDTVWVVDADDNKLYAYALDGGRRVPGSDVDTLGAAGNTDPRDVWSDGDTIWVADRDDAKLYAYGLDGGARRPELDFDTLEAAGNTNPRGVWSDGYTMWVSDPGDDKLYAYKMPPAQTDPQQAQGQAQQEPLQQEPLQQEPLQQEPLQQEPPAQRPRPARRAVHGGVPQLGDGLLGRPPRRHHHRICGPAEGQGHPPRGNLRHLGARHRLRRDFLRRRRRRPRPALRVSHQSRQRRRHQRQIHLGARLHPHRPTSSRAARQTHRPDLGVHPQLGHAHLGRPRRRHHHRICDPAEGQGHPPRRNIPDDHRRHRHRHRHLHRQHRAARQALRVSHQSRQRPRVQRHLQLGARLHPRRPVTGHRHRHRHPTTSVLSLWFAVFRSRRRPMIGMPTHSQHPRRDRPRHHKGVDVSHPRCIMVSSRKHHRSVLRYRPDRGRDHVVGADPSQGLAGRVREPRRWWLGVGPSEGVRSGIFRVLGPPGPARRDGRHVPGYL